MKKILGMIFVSTLFVAGCGSDISKFGGVDPEGGQEHNDGTVKPPVEVDFQEAVSSLVNSSDNKNGHLYDFETGISNESFNDNQSSMYVDFSVGANSFKNGFDKLLTFNRIRASIQENDDLASIKNILNSFNIDNVFSEDYEKSSYKLYNNKIYESPYIEQTTEKEPEFLFMGNIHIPSFEYTKLKIQDLKNVKEHINNDDKSKDENLYITYKNPKSKKYIFEGTSVGKPLKDTVAEEVIMYESDKKVNDDTLDSILKFINIGIKLPEENGVTYYPLFGVTDLDEDYEYGIAFNTKDNNLMCYESIMSPGQNGIPTLVGFKKCTKNINVNAKYSISKIEDNNTKDVYTIPFNIGLKGIFPDGMNPTKITLKKCHYVKVDKINPSENERIRFIPTNAMFFCLDQNNMVYNGIDFYKRNETKEFYNYEAVQEKVEFTKKFIENKITK